MSKLKLESSVRASMLMVRQASLSDELVCCWMMDMVARRQRPEGPGGTVQLEVWGWGKASREPGIRNGLALVAQVRGSSLWMLRQRWRGGERLSSELLRWGRAVVARRCWVWRRVIEDNCFYATQVPRSSFGLSR